jgi:small-conductance mechanosensitive channel
MIQKTIYTAIAVLVIFLISNILKRKAKEISKSKNLKKTRYFAIRRLISFATLFLFIITVIIVWGIDIKDLWISIVGILAMIAIAFVAVWSLIGNVLAGIMIYFTTPFKIDDTVEILPEQIKGKVLAINTIFTVLQEEDGNYINIPNSLFFQKFIRNMRNG